jgi:hypothetical protein
MRALYSIKCVLRIFWQTWLHILTNQKKSRLCKHVPCNTITQSRIDSVICKIVFVNFIYWKKILSSRPLKSVNTWNRSPFWNALSGEFRCRWRHLSCKLRPEIDNGFTFTLIKTTMRSKQIRKYIYMCRFWCQNGAILLLPFWLNNQSQIFPEKHSL